METKLKTKMEVSTIVSKFQWFSNLQLEQGKTI